MHSIFVAAASCSQYRIVFLPTTKCPCDTRVVTFDRFPHRKLKRIMKGKNNCVFSKCFKLKPLWCLTLVFIAINCPKHVSLTIKALDKWCVYRGELKCSSSWTKVCEPLWNILASFHQSTIFWKRKEKESGRRRDGEIISALSRWLQWPSGHFFCPPFWDKWFNWKKKRKEMILVEDCGSESLAAGRCAG